MVVPSRTIAVGSFFAGSKTRRMRCLSGIGLMICFLFFLPLSRLAAAEPPNMTEYQLKAAFLYNFIKFTEWPEHQLGSGSEPFVIGVLGKDPFGPVLDQVVQGETFRNKAVVVRRFSKIGQAALESHVLFISASEESQLRPILNLLEGKSVLTVSEINDFAERGGIIQLKTENNKVAFDINLEAARRAELVMNAQLLKLARIVGSKSKTMR
jgi:hypothetical protein